MSYGRMDPHTPHACCSVLSLVSGPLYAYVPSVGEKCILKRNNISFFHTICKSPFTLAFKVIQFQFQYLPKIFTYSFSIWPDRTKETYCLSM